MVAFLDGHKYGLCFGNGDIECDEFDRRIGSSMNEETDGSRKNTGTTRRKNQRRSVMQSGILIAVTDGGSICTKHHGWKTFPPYLSVRRGRAITTTPELQSVLESILK